jgi:HlyD family secretion protein
MIKKLAFMALGLLLIAGTFMVISSRTRSGPCRITGTFSVSDVTFGKFTESIPSTGEIKDKSVVATIDELYLRRIKVGLNASNNNTDLIVTDVDSTVKEGRFSIKLKAKDSQLIPPDGHGLRFRIFLSSPTQATLLPVGGFYKDTGGKWILVVKDSMHVVKRYISLGRKNPDYFEVLSGLNPREKVITSSYENYTRFDFRKIVALEDLKNSND